MQLILSTLPGIPMIHQGDNLVEIVWGSIQRCGIELQDGDILVIAQKIVSKSEGRFVNLSSVQVTPQAAILAEETDKDPRLVQVILAESNQVLRSRPGTIIVEHRCGFVCANAGIDRSNVTESSSGDDEWVLLLPVDPDGSAAKIRSGLELKSGARLGVSIIDSHGRAWRMGIVGMTIGLSGLPGLVDMRSQPDLFNRELKITQIAAADELAAAASLMMGQASEGLPVVHVRGFPYQLREANFHELLRPKELDLFR